MFVHADIRNQALVEDALERHALDTRRALRRRIACRPLDRRPGAFIDTNVVGTSRAAQGLPRVWLRKTASACASFRFHHVSTDEVYGSLGATEPRRSPRRRLRAELARTRQAKPPPTIWCALTRTPTGCRTLDHQLLEQLRALSVSEKLIPLMILNALEGKPLPVYGDGMNVRDWLYVEDHCAGIERVLHAGRVGRDLQHRRGR